MFDKFNNHSESSENKKGTIDLTDEKKRLKSAMRGLTSSNTLNSINNKVSPVFRSAEVL